MDPSYTTSMSPIERYSFQQVSEWCQSDVQRLCSDNAPRDFMAPPMLDVASLLEDMMMRSFQEPAPRDLGMAPPHQQEPESDRSVLIVRGFGCDGDVFVNHVLMHFVPLIGTAVDAPEELASSITEQAQVLSERFEGEGDNRRLSIARRLSEVTPQEIEQHRRRVLFLPFSDQQNECLTRLRSQVSMECGQALEGLLQTRAAQFQSVLEQRREALDVYANFCLLYALLTFAAAVLYVRRRRSLVVPPAQIFQAIYSRPKIKEAVENEVGSSIGSVPPFMTMRGIDQLRQWTLLAVAVMAFLVLFDVVSGANALAVCVFLAAFLCFRALLWTPSDDSVDCTCCCCGGTPQDKENPTEAQACCKCCQGTGVCAVNCASCCGDDGCCSGGCDSNGCCSGGGCCGSDNEDECCNSEYQLLMEEDKGAQKVLPRKLARQEIYEGVPVQIV